MKMYNLTVNNNNYEVVIKEVTANSIKALVNGKEYSVDVNGVKNMALPAQAIGTHTINVSKSSSPKTTSSPSSFGGATITSPIPGQVKEIFVKEGDIIEVGQRVLILEAMKLENEITANNAGKVKKILVNVGDTVNQDQILFEIGE